MDPVSAIAGIHGSHARSVAAAGPLVVPFVGRRSSRSGIDPRSAPRTERPPADAREVEPMLRYAAAGNSPAAIRYPRTTAPRLERTAAPIEAGKAEVLREGADGAIAVLGERARAALEVAGELAALPGPERLDLAVINARFAKPLDTETLLAPLREGKFLLTVEEGVLAGGFGSALLEAASDAGVNTQKIRRLGIGDAYTPHGSRDELLRLIGLDPGVR